MVPVPLGGYPGVSNCFDRCYSHVLDKLQLAWTTSGEAGDRHFEDAVFAMSELRPLAHELMCTPRPDLERGNYGPTFQFYGDD